MRSARAQLWKAVLAFAAVYSIWGSTYLAIRLAIATLPPLLMAGTRFLIAGSLLWIWDRWRHGARASRREWRAAALVGVSLFAGGNGAVVWAEQRVPSGLVALLVSMVPVWIVLMDGIRPGGSRPSRPVVWGVLLGLGGVALLLGPERLAGAGRVDLVGASVVLLGSISWAAGSLYARTAPLPRRPVLANGMEMLSGGVLLVAAGLAGGEAAKLTTRAWAPVPLAALGYLVVFGSMVAFSAYAWLLRNVATAKAATYAYVNPVVALLLGWGAADEPLTWRTLTAAAVILSAVVVIVTFRAPGPTQRLVAPDAGPGPAAGDGR